ncbi:hypothetical protein IW261DRAFT_1565995 [Armillaria novae-zelandiae]|uniref:Uncharacterized protein n=1 Tax=Armillaria novae-zelandiae TaxID=153914 RepID=A0AA39U938_9AGAR|nr:hypothetical protein IW261DRAFT_1565995 [Armillaria novae-zelandiae]
MAPSYVESAMFHVHEAAAFVSSCANLLPGHSSFSLTADSWDLVFSSPIEWLEFQLVLWATLQQIAMDDTCLSGEESPRSTPAPPPPVAGPSKPRKHPLVSSSVDEDGANKCACLTSLPRLTAAQKGKGCATSAAHITTKQGRLLAMTKDVHKVAVKGGLGEKTPEDAVEVDDLALMPLGLLVPDKDYGDFIGCDSHYFHRSWWSLCDACSTAGAQCRTIRSGSGKCFRCAIHKHTCLFNGERTVNKAHQVFVPHPALIQNLCARFAQALKESVCIADYQGKVPATLHQTHAENIENLSGLFELRVKEWKDLVDVDAEVAFETEGEDEDEDEDESS